MAVARGLARRGRARQSCRRVQHGNARLWSGRLGLPVHARLGDFDGAIAWLERGIATKSGLVPLIGLLFDLDPLREEPRYEALLRRVGIPETVDLR